jgi:hypothetical protein
VAERREVEDLVEALFSVEEPWRTRFLGLTANLATGWTWDGQQPNKARLTTWLQTDPDLDRKVRVMVRAWLK